MRILITGCNGLLGQSLVRTAPVGIRLGGIDLHRHALVPGFESYACVDIASRKPLLDFAGEFRPDWIVNCAAYTDVDKAEKERGLCWKVNVNGVENLAFIARKFRAKLVHLSTDYVFDGKNGPYHEEAVPNPLGFYARSKLASENAVRFSPVDYAIVRTMVLYGTGTDVRPNFVSWLVGALKRGEEVNIVSDQYGNTTLVDELAQGIWRIVQMSFKGVVHIAGREILDRYHFALHIADVFDCDRNLVNPISTSDLKQAAPRPLKSGLKVDKALHVLGIELSDVIGGLEKLKKRSSI